MSQKILIVDNESQNNTKKEPGNGRPMPFPFPGSFFTHKFYH